MLTIAEAAKKIAAADATAVTPVCGLASLFPLAEELLAALEEAEEVADEFALEFAALDVSVVASEELFSVSEFSSDDASELSSLEVSSSELLSIGSMSTSLTLQP